MEKEYFIQNVPFSKSINFLFPLLGFSRVEKFIPDGTYLYSSEFDYSIDDYNLIVYYQQDLENVEFKKFEEKQILNKHNLIACYKVEDGILYVFDMIDWSNSVAEFMQGRYSKFEEKDKKVILSYFGDANNKAVIPGRVIFMALEPHYFYSAVAEELEVPESSLKELVNKFDIEDEICYKTIVGENYCCPDKKTYYLGNGT